MTSHGSDHEAQVRQVIADWAKAVRARDINKILEHHTPDFVMFDVPPPFMSKGLEAYRKTWEQFLSWSVAPARFDIQETHFDIQEISVVAGTDVAFAFARMACFGPDRDGVPQALNFRLTMGLRKIAGKWMIVHEHHSVPAED